MRILLSTIGTRGDVQPLVAIALALQAQGQEVRLCVPPDFRDWIESLGMFVISIGPELRPTGRANLTAARPTLEQRRQMMADTVATQFETIAAVQGCDVSEVNQPPLFKRVAAVVHHGSAGTTTTATLVSALQVVIPQMYDQHYWAHRIHNLGIGIAHAPGTPTSDSLAIALQLALQPGMATRAQSIATTIQRNGVQTAAQRLITSFY